MSMFRYEGEDTVIGVDVGKGKDKTIITTAKKLPSGIITITGQLIVTHKCVICGCLFNDDKELARCPNMCEGLIRRRE